MRFPIVDLQQLTLREEIHSRAVAARVKIFVYTPPRFEPELDQIVTAVVPKQHQSALFYVAIDVFDDGFEPKTEKIYL